MYKMRNLAATLTNVPETSVSRMNNTTANVRIEARRRRCIGEELEIVFLNVQRQFARWQT